MNIINESRSTLNPLSPTKSNATLEKSEEEIIRRNEQQKKPNSNQATASAIDYKLDVNIEISRGKCVMHAVDPIELPQIPKKQQQTIVNQAKPTFPNKSNQKGFINPVYQYNTQGANEDTKNAHDKYFERYLQHLQKYENHITNIIFPEIRMKTYYESTHVEMNKRMLKKAKVYSNILIESFFSSKFKRNDNIEDNMCIGPQLLNFLELTLKPFDLENKENAKQNMYHEEQSTDNEIDEELYENEDEEASIKHHNEANEKKNSTITQMQAYYPIDVIILVSIKPSSILFTCAPTSTMDCMLKLPETQLVFTTKSLSSIQSQSESIAGKKLEIFKPQNLFDGAFYLDSILVKSKVTDLVVNNDSGGLSVTCCMDKFSLKFYNRLAINKTGPFFSKKDSMLN